MTSKSALGLMAAAAIAGSAAFGFASAAPRADHVAAGAGGGVSQAAFDRLEGQVQDLQRRVAALEKSGGHTGGHTGHGRTAGDSWANP